MLKNRLTIILFLFTIHSQLFAQNNSLLNVNFKNLISGADLEYTKPASRSEEGMPIGNGITGSLVWTEPFALKFQINRVDVFANDATSVSFPKADSDYGSGCGYVDINVVQSGDNVFSGNDFHQHLSVYDGLMTAKGKGMTAKAFAYHGKDIIAVQIDDQRENPEPINIDLRMLRYRMECIYNKSYELKKNHEVIVRTVEHTAASQLLIDNGRIILTQKYREKKYYDASGVAIQVLGRKSKARFLNGSTVQLSAVPQKGKFTILISSAAAFDSTKNIEQLALDNLNSVSGKSFETLYKENSDWWKNFWSQGYVHMHSKDEQADFVEQNYNYFLYIMGSTSLGKYPPRFGGLLFNTNGDMRRWGSQYWWSNTSAYYRNLIPANRLDLIQPVISMYSGMYDACAIAAKQQWGSKGIYIPEITPFSGPEKLPDDIAAELQDLMLVRKPYKDHSAKFQWFVETKNRHEARWNFQADGYYDHGHYIVPTKAEIQPDRFSSPEAIDGIFGHCTHFLSSGARIAELYWHYFQSTMDTNWLREYGYRQIKGSAEFYRNFPNLTKDTDGKYHIHHVNNVESNWNGSDQPNEISTMNMIFPVAIKAAEILGIDSDLQNKWKEVKDNLYQLPETSHHNYGQRGGYGAFVGGGPGAIEPLGSEKDIKSLFLSFNRTGGFIDTTGIGGAQIFRNRLRLREGPGAIDAEHIGGLTSGIHTSLLKDDSKEPGDDPVLKIFSVWPKDWDCEFKLLAPGAFVVTSAQEKGKIQFVKLHSNKGGQCSLENPWNEEQVTFYRDGKKSENKNGFLLKFNTSKGEDIIIVREGTKPEDFKQSIL